MGCKRRIVSAAVIHMKNHGHVKDLSLQVSVLSVLAEHHENVLRHRKLRLRCIDIQIFASPVIVSMISVYHKHRELADQVQTLAQHVRDACIVSLRIIGIKLQDTSRDTVHHIAAGRLHDDIAYKVRREHTAFRHHFLEVFQFLFIRKFSKEQQICRFLKTRMLCIKKSFDQFFDIISSIVKISLAGNALSINYF